MNGFENQNYISLSEAAKIFGYSPEYLNFLIRQGKLKGQKFGRNWMTKKEWVEKYFKKVETSRQEILESVRTNAGKDFFAVFKITTRNFFSDSVAVKKLQVSLIIILVSFLGVVNFYLIGSELINSSLSQLVVVSANTIAMETVVPFKNCASALADIINTDGIKYGFSYLFKTANNICSRFYQSLKYTSKQSGDISSDATNGSQNGLIVVPSVNTADDNKNKEKIKSLFSDEVKVEKTDNSSGFIIPVFKDRDGDKYMYVMVPVKN
jgi:hypothetical protein